MQGFRGEKGAGKEKVSGEVTAFLTMVFLLFISLISGLMEAASIQIAKNERRVDMNCAVESVFAEYQRDLLEEFQIFAVEGSYESGEYSEDLLIQRLAYYGASGIENQIEAIRLLSDSDIFREQILCYIEEKYGKDWLASIGSHMESWEEKDQEVSELQEYVKGQEQSLEALLSEEQSQLPSQNNPLPNMKSIQNKPLVQLVMPKDVTVSTNQISLSETLSHRERRSGYGSFSGGESDKGLSTVAFGEYVLQHFQSASQAIQQKEEEKNLSQGLQYELEYIIAGKESDNKNISKVIEKLLLIRMASNYSYVLMDSGKRAEVEALALTLTSLVLAPEAAEIVAQILLAAWAFGESIVDIRTLLAGNRVPMKKSAGTWQLSLASLLTLGTKEDTMEGSGSDQGLSYEEYLRILLYTAEKVSGKQLITMRVLDMVEQRLRMEKEYEWFRVDNCICKLEMKSVCNLRRGISYRFHTYFGYH